MITVTTPSVVNNLTPLTEGISNNSAGTATVSNVDFTNALNAQLTAATASTNLTGAPVLDEAALITAQTALLAATAESSENNTSNNQASPVLTGQQFATATTTLTAELVPSATTMLLATSKANPLTPPEIAITNADSEILSNVTDTLKFIATGVKLGDTLPEGQVIRLQNVNASTPLTQQTVQAAVQQSVNMPVNTPAAVLAQQAMPVQTGGMLSNQQTQSAEMLDETAVADIQNKIAVNSAVDTEKTIVSTTPTQTQIVKTQQDVVVTAMSTQAQNPQTKLPVGTVTPAQTQIVQSEKSVVTATTTQAVQTETPVVTATSMQAQTVQSERAVVTLTQAQAIQTEKSVVATTPMQAKNVQTEKPVPVVTAMPTQAQAVQTEEPVVIATTTQTEKTVSTTIAQTQAVPTEKPVVITVATEKQQTVSNVVSEVTTIDNKISEQGITGEISTQPLQNELAIKNTLKNNGAVDSDELLQNEESSLIQTSQNSVQNESEVTVEVSEKPSNSNTTADTQESSMLEERMSEITAAAVAAQTVPIQIEADAATFDAPSSSTSPEDKPALTPAKNLLADVLANRNNSGDTTNNSSDKKGSDTPANTASLPTDNAAKNTFDNKALETKSFASLLNTEKSDASSALSAATTNDKVAPQVAAAVVNKLAQDMKADVPALTRPLSHPNWNQEVGERIIWMNNRGISSAEIRMNPENMGPITVRIDVDAQQQTSVSFSAQNADVRVALEASIPKLREMLSSQNLNLADVNVSQQSSTSADSNSSQRQNMQMAADASGNGQGNRQSNQEVDANGNPIRQVGANGEEIAIDEFANGQVIEGNGTNGLLSIFA